MASETGANSLNVAPTTTPAGPNAAAPTALEASSTIEQAQTRSNVMTRRLKSVEALPEPRVAQLLPGLLTEDPGEDAGTQPGGGLDDARDG